MKTAYKIALACGVAPLLIGVIILAGWILNGSEKFLIAGVFNIGIGVLLFITGLISLAVYYHLAKKQNIHDAFKTIILPLVILVANFPAAAGCVYVAYYLETAPSITIVNQTAGNINNVQLHTRQIEHDNDGWLLNDRKILETQFVKLIPAKNTFKKRIRFTMYGSVDYLFNYDGRKKQGQVFEYIGPKMGRVAVITISENGKVTVVDKRRRR